MRIITSLVIASALAAASASVQAENAPAEPAKTEVSAPPAAPDKSAEADKAVTQTKIVEPRKSGLDQPLCTGE